jgi:hypothetical protein
MMRFLRRKPNPKRYTKRWKELQKHCATRKTWPKAIVEADKLVDDALKARRYKGKTTGERLVAAQHALSDNEAVWFSHKLRNSIDGVDVRKLKKQDIFEALAGFRQALKDLGALKNDKS